MPISKEQAYDTLRDTFNEFIDSAAQNPPESFAGAYEQLMNKCADTFNSCDGPLTGELPELPCEE